VECANGGVAELVRSTGPELRALMTDVELGGEMSGVQLAQSQYAKRRFPDLSVVYALRPRSVLRSARTHFLMQPYPPQQLLDAVLS
jgi:hypothetical protein